MNALLWGVDPTDKDSLAASTSILAVLLRRLSAFKNHNSPYQAQTDDFQTRYARKTDKIFLLFVARESLSVGYLHHTKELYL
jgi:hypothetical protein